MEARAGDVDEERLVRPDKVEPELQMQVDVRMDIQVAAGTEPDELTEYPQVGVGQVEIERASSLGGEIETEVEVQNLVGRVERQDRVVRVHQRRQAEQVPKLGL